MRRYILTGAPGAGKTTLIRELAARGHAVVEEAATDIIAEAQARGVAQPWLEAGFLQTIAERQAERIEACRAEIQFHDRSPIGTRALATHLGQPEPSMLDPLITRLVDGAIFQPKIFFVDNLGFCEPTAARRISFEDSLVFEETHAATYRGLGFELVHIPAAEVSERLNDILRLARL